MTTIENIADMIEPREAQLAVAKIVSHLGSQEEWHGAEDLEIIAEMLIGSVMRAGLPNFTDQDDDALDFYQTVVW